MISCQITMKCLLRPVYSCLTGNFTDSLFKINSLLWWIAQRREGNRFGKECARQGHRVSESDVFSLGRTIFWIAGLHFDKQIHCTGYCSRIVIPFQ